MNRPLDLGTTGEFRADRRLDVLIPTRNRPAELAVTLAGLAAQVEVPDFGVVVSDQSDGDPAYAHPAAATMVRALRQRGHPVLLTRRLPRRGLAEHRAYLLGRSAARYVLCLDDDVWLEPGTLRRLVTAIGELGCGFVGNAVHGLSYVDDVRPETHGHYEEWDGPAVPGAGPPRHPAVARCGHPSGREPAAHQQKLALPPGAWRAYKVSWIGGCVLYDRAQAGRLGRLRLLAAGAGEPPGRGRRRPARRAGPVRRRGRPAQRGVPPGVADHGHRPGRRGVGGRLADDDTPSRPEPCAVPAADRQRSSRGPGPSAGGAARFRAEQVGGGFQHLGHRHVGDERVPVRAVAVAGPVRIDPRRAVDPADRAAHRPGERSGGAGRAAASPR